MTETKKRWHVTVTYFSEKGDIDVEHFIEELEDLQEIIERGPNWYAVKDIVIILNVPDEHRMTLEHDDAGLKT